MNGLYLTDPGPAVSIMGIGSVQFWDFLKCLDLCPFSASLKSIAVSLNKRPMVASSPNSKSMRKQDSICLEDGGDASALKCSQEFQLSCSTEMWVELRKRTVVMVHGHIKLYGVSELEQLQPELLNVLG